MSEQNELAERLRRLQEHAARLEEKKRDLERDLEDVEHQERRLSDRLERGERSADLDEASRRLNERRDMNISDQRSTSREIETLRQQREELEEWLRQMRGDAST